MSSSERIITFDLETKSYADLKKVGAWSYSEDPTTDVICACWGVGHEPIAAWWPQCPFPNMVFDPLFAMIRDGYEVEAHNVAFERSIWTNILAPRYGWPIPRDKQWRDTMAVAAYYALPMQLDKLATVLGFQSKDPEGARLIQKYSKLYHKHAKTVIPPEDMLKWVEYCKRDVQIEQSISDYLLDLPDRELPVFLLDQKINMRGLYLDKEGIENACAIVDQRSEELNAEFKRLVGWNPGQRDKCLEWFKAQGVELADFSGDTIEEVLEDGDIGAHHPARRPLQIKLAVNKSSTKKLDAMLRQRGRDGRSRFQSRYHGAGTGRWTGTGWQPLNLVRSWEDVEPERLVQDISYRDPEYLDMVYGSATEAVAKAARHWIKAEEGNKIVAGDFVSIEAVVLACGAGETWKKQAFADGVKIYEAMADKIYKLPPGTVTKKTHPNERQDGKTAELAFGYQGGLNAWLNFDSSGRHSDEAIESIKTAWRLEHPCIVQFWRGLERAAIAAVRHGEGKVFYQTDFDWDNVAPEAVRVGFEMVKANDDPNDNGRWLTMILPDGKRLWYWKPELRMGMPAWHKPDDPSDDYEDCRLGRCDCKPVPKLCYMAQKNGQFKRVYTYGGKLAENWTQATSRQILVPAMLRAEQAGYSIILSVYDEIVCEVPKAFGSKEDFEKLMEVREPWFADWPVRCDAWEGERYRK